MSQAATSHAMSQGETSQRLEQSRAVQQWLGQTWEVAGWENTLGKLRLGEKSSGKDLLQYIYSKFILSS